MSDYPVSKTQKMVLDALSLSANSYSEAEELFANHGLGVVSKRQGRSVVPVITTGIGYGGWCNGEGNCGTIKCDLDTSKIAQWIVK